MASASTRCTWSSRPRSSFVTRRVLLALLSGSLAAVAAASAFGRHERAAYVLRPLVSDRADPQLVNAWGLAASPTGPWWTANEARESSTLYSGAGRKQLLTVTVEGGPTGIVAYS